MVPSSLHSCIVVSTESLALNYFSHSDNNGVQVAGIFPLSALILLKVLLCFKLPKSQHISIFLKKKKNPTYNLFFLFSM